MTPRRSRRLPCAAVLGLVLLPGAPAARAAGTGGVEVTPVPGVVHGQQVTSFRVDAPPAGRAQVPFALRNVTTTARSARLYAAAATRQPDGSFQIGPAGSSPHVGLRDEVVRLAADALEQRTFTVRSGVEQVSYAALVVEVGSRGAVVTRAATLVRLEPPEEDQSLPRVLVLTAAAVALAAGAGVGGAARRSARRSPRARQG